MTIITVYAYILFSNLTGQFGSNFSILWQILICIVQQNMFPWVNYYTDYWQLLPITINMKLFNSLIRLFKAWTNQN